MTKSANCSNRSRLSKEFDWSSGLKVVQTQTLCMWRSKVDVRPEMHLNRYSEQNWSSIEDHQTLPHRLPEFLIRSLSSLIKKRLFWANFWCFQPKKCWIVGDSWEMSSRCLNLFNLCQVDLKCTFLALHPLRIGYGNTIVAIVISLIMFGAHMNIFIHECEDSLLINDHMGPDYVAY